MHVFLTGATGYIGSAVADALLASGHSVTGLARSDEAAGLLHLKGVAPHRGDLHSPDSVVRAAGASDAVIHTGTTNDGVSDREAIRAMLAALEGSDSPFVYTSGIWILGDTGGRVVDETAPVNPIPRVAWRPGVEQMVLEARGVRGIVIRPGVVYGRGGGILADFVRSARELGAARYVGAGQNHWPSVHVEDLANLYLLALEKAPAGTLLHAAERVAHRVKQIAEAASFGAGACGRTIAWPIEEARQTLGGYADALALDQQTSAARAQNLLGWKPRADGILEDLRHGSYAS